MKDNLAYKEEPRYEIIGGNVVMMASPTFYHNEVKGNIFNIFYNFLKGKKCRAVSNPTDLYLENGERYIPDMMVVCDQTKIDEEKGVVGAPDLVVEVLSPSTAKYDRMEKKDAYERNGVREYWIVIPKVRTVEQYVLSDGRFVLHGVYVNYTPRMLEKLDGEDRSHLVTEFKCSIFDDLTIRLDDVFDRVSE